MLTARETGTSKQSPLLSMVCFNAKHLQLPENELSHVIYLLVLFYMIKGAHLKNKIKIQIKFND